MTPTEIGMAGVFTVELARNGRALPGSPRSVRMRGKRMSIFVGEADRWQHRPVYLAILERLKAAGCAGATVTRGIAGFGAHSHIKTADILVLSVDLPVVITVVDTPERIEVVLEAIAPMLAGGTVTVEDTEVRFYSAAFEGGLPDVRVGDVMSTEVECVTESTPVAEVVERLLARDYTALPVVDAERRVVGVVSDADLLESGVTRLSLSVHKAVGRSHVEEVLGRLKREGAVVRQAMTAPAVTVTTDTPLKRAARVMHERGLKRLPVVDDEGKLVGILGRLDILESVLSGHRQRTVPHAARLPQEHTTVGEIMDREVPAVAETAPVRNVGDHLIASEVKRVVVIDEARRPLGIITDTDLVRRVDPAERPGLLTQLRSRWNARAWQQVRRSYGQRAADVMTAPVVSVRDDAPVIDALTLTVTRHVKRMPVVDTDGRLVGIVSRPALLAASLG